jgi:hypothetical protein
LVIIDKEWPLNYLGGFFVLTIRADEATIRAGKASIRAGKASLTLDEATISTGLPSIKTDTATRRQVQLL